LILNAKISIKFKNAEGIFLDMRRVTPCFWCYDDIKKQHKWCIEHVIIQHYTELCYTVLFIIKLYSCQGDVPFSNPFQPTLSNGRLYCSLWILVLVGLYFTISFGSLSPFCYVAHLFLSGFRNV